MCAHVSSRVAPLSVAAVIAAALGLGAGAFAGAPAQSPQPKPRPTPVAPTPSASAEDGGAILNPWGNGQYERVWRAGDKIGQFNFHLIASYKRYRLPPPPSGEVYVALGTQVLRVDMRDWKVVASVGKVDTILGVG
ncbi:hypothetical protein U879_20195 [Defluviimonas sp. 20V17]|nr:hypothetical protein U879_20195 [Defluviimonas sp. 20V17]